MMNADSTVSAPPGKRSATRIFLWWFSIITGLVNVAAVIAAHVDRSLGAVLIGLIAGPAANGVLALLGLVATYVVRRRHPDASRKLLIAYSLLIPVAAIILDAMVIIFVIRPSAC